MRITFGGFRTALKDSKRLASGGETMGVRLSICFPDYVRETLASNAFSR